MIGNGIALHCAEQLQALLLQGKFDLPRAHERSPDCRPAGAESAAIAARSAANAARSAASSAKLAANRPLLARACCLARVNAMKPLIRNNAVNPPRTRRRLLSQKSTVRNIARKTTPAKSNNNAAAA